jgi:hypothetical protein
MGSLAKSHYKKSTRQFRKLNDEEEVGVDEEGDEIEADIDDENPDLEMLEDLEKETGGESDIFQEILDQKLEMLERLKLLEAMVNEELLDMSDGEDVLKKPIKHEGDDDHLNEPEENWVLLHRQRLINICIVGVIIAFIILIGWKLSKISKDVIEKKKAVKLFHKKLEEVDEKEIDSLVASWKDQREGIGKQDLKRINLKRIHCKSNS